MEEDFYGPKQKRHYFSWIWLISLVFFICVGFVAYLFLNGGGSRCGGNQNDKISLYNIIEKIGLNNSKCTHRTKEPGSTSFKPSTYGNPNPLIPLAPINKGTPYSNTIGIATSQDNKVWKISRNEIIGNAGSPEFLASKNILFYVDRKVNTIGCALVDQAYTDGHCRIYNFTGKVAWDPEIIKIGDYYRMYYVSPLGNLNNTPSQSVIMTATSRDGITWLEEGKAFSMENNSYVGNPSVAKINDKWLMFTTNRNNEILKANSVDGKEFTFTDKLVDLASDSIGVYHLNNMLNIYYTTKNGINLATSANDTDSEWIISPDMILTNNNNTSYVSADIEKTTNGEYALYYELQTSN